MKSSSKMNRREFLKRLGVLGGGVIIGFNTFDRRLWARMQRTGFLGAGIPNDFNAFLRIAANNRVALYTGKIEMGQGTMTSLPQLLAEELYVNIEAVDIIMGDTDLCPWDAGTFGSLSIRHFGVFLREAAVEARGLLLELAADRFKAPVGRLATENGIVFDRAKPNLRVSYGELTSGKIIEKRLQDLPPLKPPSAFGIMGKSVPRRDALEKVTGTAKFSGDIRLEGMLYAKILRPPAHGAKLIKADTAAAKKIDGLQIVEEGDFIAVLHKYPDVAEQGLARIKAQYDRPKTGVNDRTIFDHLLKSTPSPEIASQAGNLKTGEKQAATVIEKTYLNSYVSHAPMEPHTAVADFDGKKLTVWASTQTPFRVKETIAERLGPSANSVRVIAPYLGGAFGGKSASQQAFEAARLAKRLRKPVQVAWSRAEEFFFDTFRPAAIVKIKSGLDSAARIALWDYNVYYAGKRGCEQFYEIPHHKEVVHGRWRGLSGRYHPFAVGPWRAPANNTNTYARDLQLNLMAAIAGADPLQFRLAHLKDNRMISVLKAAAEKFNWQPIKTPSGRGYGIACGIDAGTYVAFMAQVEVDKSSGGVDVKRVVCAQDMGVVVNPDGAATQMEGCITMGLGYALSEEVRFSDGELLDLNFDTYSIPTFSLLPKIETVILENPSLAPQGEGVERMQVQEAIQRRLSIRRYAEGAIPAEHLDILFKALQLAASGNNYQNWEFVFVGDADVKQRLVVACNNQVFVRDCTYFIAGVADPTLKWHMVDITIAMTQLALQAVALGYGTCWIGAFDEAQVKSVLNIPETKKVVICMTLGLPAGRHVPRGRKAIEEFIYQDQFGIQLKLSHQ